MNTMTEPKGRIKTPELILDAAQTLILTEGFRGVSVDRIIEEAGVSKGTFFYHFKSKEALAIRLLDRFFDNQRSEIRSRMEAAQEAHSDARTAILSFIESLSTISTYNNVGGNTATGCIMAAFSYQLIEDIAELKTTSETALETWSNYLSPYFQKMLDEYPPAEETSSKDIAKMLFTLVQGTYIARRISPEWTSLDTQLTQFKQYLTLLCPR